MGNSCCMGEEDESETEFVEPEPPSKVQTAQMHVSSPVVQCQTKQGGKNHSGKSGSGPSAGFSPGSVAFGLLTVRGQVLTQGSFHGVRGDIVPGALRQHDMDMLDARTEALLEQTGATLKATKKFVEWAEMQRGGSSSKCDGVFKVDHKRLEFEAALEDLKIMDEMRDMGLLVYTKHQ